MREVLAAALRVTRGRTFRKVVGLYALLLGANALAWAWAVVVFHDHPVLLGTAFLAYTLGLGHAIDADHIAAIDNVTRKLIQEGQRPVGVGLFFSLGHSTVVVLASVVLAATAAALQSRYDTFREVGGLIGTSISALFLFAIAIANLFILVGVYRTFQAVRRGERYADMDLDAVLSGGGAMAHRLRSLFRLIGASWHMYPIGFLFGLGFDTATQIGVLGIAAAEATQGLSIWSILVFPALFTAGMSLVDATDGVLMLGAYGWAFVRPIRKLYYNMTITFVSVLVALVIGGVESLGLIADQLRLEGPFWSMIAELTDHFGALGYLVIGIFVLSWVLSAAVYRLGRFDQIDAAGD